MKKKSVMNVWAIGIAGGLSLGVFNALANMEVSASVRINAAADFYNPLAACGTWVQVGSYGRCWRPAQVAVGWRPYCEGQWVWTDCGWYWESDEPWAWACYHYGGWVCDPGLGWIWVPGVEWAPSWVSWRVGGDYIGWAPLGPGGVFLGARLAIGSPFVFVGAGHFHERVRASTVIVNNTTIINKTKQITNIKSASRSIGGSRAQKVMVNEGPGAEYIQKATGHPVKAVPVQEVATRTSVPASVMHKAPERTTRATPPAGHEQPESVKKPAETAPERRAPTPLQPKFTPNRRAVVPERAAPPVQPMPTPPANERRGSEQVAPTPPAAAPSRPEPSPGARPEAPRGNGGRERER